jgi:serine/threonine-protein kinase
MQLEPGSKLGQYEILSSLGAGGMGEVYRARDTKLDRDVALKVLLEAFTADPERLARFEREAKVLASLNHPNIGGIHGIEESGGVRALVLELIEGPTLAERIERGPVPLAEAIEIARQITEALEAAHEVGVIHRDLKPANIKLRDDGTVKVLDFGLAKALDGTPAPDADVSQSPTLTAATQMGVILGTAAYMSPEQARGKPVDKRCDIWAFGAVLFEMLSGARPFPGEDVSHTLARVIERDPDWEALPDGLPPTIDAFLRRCLHKDPRSRVRDIGDVRLALSGAFDSHDDIDEPERSPAPSPWQRALPWAAAAVLAFVAVAVTRWSKPAPAPPRVVSFAVGEAAGLAASVPAFNAALAPDGRFVVLRLQEGIAIHHLADRDEVKLPDTAAGYGQFVSADSAQVGFFVSGTNESIVYRAASGGGTPVRVAQVPGGAIGASWGNDGTIAIGTANPSGLWRVRTDGTDAEPLTEVDGPGINHEWPHFLPGSKALLFTLTNVATGDRQIAALDLETGEQKPLLSAATAALYLATGHLLYGDGGTLYAVPFDLEELAVAGEPVAVVEGVLEMESGAASYAVARDGTLLYLQSGEAAAPEVEISWVDMSGRLEPTAIAPGPYRSLSLSPDGSRVALGSGVGSFTAGDLWVADVTTGVSTRLTFGETRGRFPLWTPDGARIVFASGRGILSKAADGTGQAELLGGAGSPASWSADGGALVFVSRSAETLNDINLLTLEDGAVRPLIETPAMETSPAVSPDGRWLAYQSNEGNAPGIFVRPFPDVSGGQWQLTQHGSWPKWAADGSALFYVDHSGGNSTLTRVAVKTGLAFSHGAPEALFDATALFSRGPLSATDRLFDLAPDGRFLVGLQSGAALDSLDLIVVVNWFEELEHLLATK